MKTEIAQNEARKLAEKLQNHPIAPGTAYSHLINVGTDHILDSLEENYFETALSDGIGCFKYLEGNYGVGKTQFIQSLARRASTKEIVSSLVTVDTECPFNSPAAIFRAIVKNFEPVGDENYDIDEGKGITVLIDSWIRRQIRESGYEPEDEVPDEVQLTIESSFEELWRGAPDNQMATALMLLTKSLVKIACGGIPSDFDRILIDWVGGENAKSPDLRKKGLFTPALDDNAFKRLKTVIAFLRKRMGFKGFLIAFDEGTRTNSFRRGTIKQRQAIENLLTMINQNTEGEFGGVMFLYAATPDFRNEVISDYRALLDRIGPESFSEGSPMVPLIILDGLATDDILYEIGDILLKVYSIAYNIEWDAKLQTENIKTLVKAQNSVFFEPASPRTFVYQCCRFLNLQRKNQIRFNDDQAIEFVGENEVPYEGDDE